MAKHYTHFQNDLLILMIKDIGWLIKALAADETDESRAEIKRLINVISSTSNCWAWAEARKIAA